MPKIKYVGNADPGDGTGAVKLEPSESGQERLLVKGGDALEVSDQEFANLRGHYLVVDVDEKVEAPKTVEPPVSNVTASANTFVSPSTKPTEGS